MELTFSEEYEYIPVFNGNRKDDKPVVVRMRYLTTPEREDCVRVKMVSVDGELQRQTSFDNEKILKRSIVEIEGLKANGMDIKTATDLFSIRGLSPLSSELADYAAGKNLTPDLKN